MNELLKRFVDAGAQPYPAKPTAFRTTGSSRKLKPVSTKLLLTCVAGLCVALVLAVMIYGL